MRRFVTIGIVVFLAIAGAAKPLVAARKASRSYGNSPYSQGNLWTGLGTGMAFNGVAFDLQLQTEYYVRDNISAGMDIDFVFKPSTLFSFLWNGKYHIPLDQIPKLTPYVGAGLGFLVNAAGAGGMDIMIPNIGFQYAVLEDRLFLGPDLSIHIDTDFSATTWEVNLLFLNLTYRF